MAGGERVQQAQTNLLHIQVPKPGPRAVGCTNPWIADPASRCDVLVGAVGDQQDAVHGGRGRRVMPHLCLWGQGFWVGNITQAGLRMVMGWQKLG